MDNREDTAVPDVPPTLDTDWKYFLSHSNSRTFPIPQYFDKEIWNANTTYKIRVSHVYDPSKFWILFKIRELDIFQSYLNTYYSRYYEHYRIPTEERKLFMYCIVYVDGTYYRGILVNIPHPVGNTILAYVYLIDVGYMSAVQVDWLFFLKRSLYSVPQFAVRATLAGIAPVNHAKWTKEVVKRFNDLVHGKILMCLVNNVDKIRKVLNIDIAEYRIDNANIENISLTLAKENLAKIMTPLDLDKQNYDQSKVKFPFLLPTFDAIEAGEVPHTVCASEFWNRCLAKSGMETLNGNQEDHWFL